MRPLVTSNARQFFGFRKSRLQRTDFSNRFLDFFHVRCLTQLELLRDLGLPCQEIWNRSRSVDRKSCLRFAALFLWASVLMSLANARRDPTRFTFFRHDSAFRDNYSLNNSLSIAVMQARHFGSSPALVTRSWQASREPLNISSSDSPAFLNTL